MESKRLPKFQVTDNLKSDGFDCILVVSPSIEEIQFKDIKEPLLKYLDIDAHCEKNVFVVACPQLPAQKIIFSGTGKLDQDHDDVQRYAQAGKLGMQKVIQSGSKAPLLFFHQKRFPQSGLVTVLAALEALYVPLEVLEQVSGTPPVKLQTLGIFGNLEKITSKLALIQALESGRIVSRDLGGSDPERMAAPNVEEYIKQEFEGDASIKIQVVQGQETFEKEYPCLAAVNRGASGHSRHDGRVIWMTYEPEGPVDKTVMLVGKGITYDTGGADVKVGGIMAGMSRDKIGAANVAGFMKVVQLLKPSNIKVIGAMAMARNSIGSNCYVSDEIITSRAGVRIRVVNTDAEGRMAMADVLAHMKEKAVKEVNPHILTLATLTGHAVRTYGPYCAVMDNGVAKNEDFARKLQATGDLYGDLFEVSTVRKEDFEFVQDKCGEFVDVLQCHNASKVQGNRGHQYPAAFLINVSGLIKHQCNAEKPLKYSHLDLGGAVGKLPDVTTGSTVVALAMHFLYH